jgi:hypothetical protein
MIIGCCPIKIALLLQSDLIRLIGHPAFPAVEAGFSGLCWRRAKNHLRGRMWLALHTCNGEDSFKTVEAK